MANTDGATRYREIARLGAGGMATVMLAEDTLLGRSVALKRVHASGDPQGVLRLKREALLGASLNHPNLVAVYDVTAEHDGDVVIVMEYVEGETLADVIESRGPLSSEETLRILKGVAAALDAIHSHGIVHRDVKPANVLLHKDGGVKLADLGIADVADRTRITSAGTVLGSFRYMAPEQLDGAPPTPAIDIYALAAVTYEMLSGEKARPESNPLALAHAIATQPPADLSHARSDTPPAASTLLKQGMSAQPSSRPATAGELVSGLQVALLPPPPSEEKPKPAPRPQVAVPARVRQRPTPATQEVTPPARGPAPPARTTASKPPLPRKPAPEAGPTPAPEPTPREDRPKAAPTPRAPAELNRGRRPTRQPTPSSTTARQRRRPRLPAAMAVIGAAAAAGVVIAVIGAGSSKSSHNSASAGGSSGSTRTSHSGSRKTPRSAATSTPASAAVGGGPASTPTGSVKAFYENAAAHRFAAAWALADHNMQSQLGGYASFENLMAPVRSITFQRDQVLSQGSDSTTVGLQTRSVQTDRTQVCSGTARTVRSGGTWLLDAISIQC